MRESATRSRAAASGSAAAERVCHSRSSRAARQVLGVLEPLVEAGALLDLLHQGRRDGLAGLPVTGVGGEDLGPEGPVLHDLGGELDEVARHRAVPLVAPLREDGLEPVPELVEEGLDLLLGEQGRRVAGRAGEVAGVGDDGTDVLAVLHPLSAQAAGPGPGALARPGMVVDEEDGQVGAVPVLHLEGPHLRIPAREVAELGEGDPVQAARDVEGALPHPVDGEVGAELVLVEVVARPPHLLGEVEPVPGLERVALPVGADGLLEQPGLPRGRALGRAPELRDERVGRRRRPGHLVVEHVVGPGRVAEQSGLLDPQRRGARGDGLVVERPALVAARGVGLEDPPAQFPVVGVLEEGPEARRVEGHHPLAGQPRLAPGLGHGGHLPGGEPGQLLGPVELEPPPVGGGEQVVPELHPQRSELPVQDLEPLLAGRIELGPGADEGLPGPLQQHLLVGLEPQRLAPLPEHLHLPEQAIVEQRVVPVPGQPRRHLPLDGLDLRRGLRRDQRPEDRLDAPQLLAGGAQRRHGVREGGGVRAGGDGFHLGPVPGHGGLEGGAEVLGLDLPERREAEGSGPLREERVRDGRRRGAERQGEGKERDVHGGLAQVVRERRPGVKRGTKSPLPPRGRGREGAGYRRRYLK